MNRYFKQIPGVVEKISTTPIEVPTYDAQLQESSSQNDIGVDLENLPSDPGLQPKIRSYPPNLIEQVDESRKHKFVASWFDDFKDWLEYIITKDAAFCLYCYLFSTGMSEKGHDAFITGGFNTWRKKDRLREHVGDHNSDHNKCRLACKDLMHRDQHIEVSFSKASEQSKIDYRCRLNATVIFVRYLIMQGLAFRGNDESEDSLNQGHFMELLKIIASCNEEIHRVALKNAPENLKLTSPEIQKDIINSAATETTNIIIKDIGNEFFSILVDECRDVSVKEQMGVVIRYVNKSGCVIERFLGLVHVSDTAATSLEKGIDSLFSTYGLSISCLRGQGYDGASNMRDEFNGLKSLILRKNPSAYYVHCFAHQLQLTVLVAVAKKNTIIGSFFNTIIRLCNIVGGSCKRRDTFREDQRKKVVEAIANNEIETGKGKNQEMSLTRPGDTRWSSHYGTLINLVHLSQALQRKDQEIVNTISLVRGAKTRLQLMRDDGWNALLIEVSNFSSKHEIVVLKMKDKRVARGRSRREVETITNLHHYRVELFYSVIDLQAQELDHRFDEVNTELLLCMACFDPRDSFSTFDKKKLLRLAEFYPSDFSEIALLELDSQLDNFIVDMHLDENFSSVVGIGDLAQKMVATRKHNIFPLVYLLLKLSLILPVATATVERAFSAMKFIKSSLRNRMGDRLLNDCLLYTLERMFFLRLVTKLSCNAFRT